MTVDDAKLEAERLCSRMQTVCLLIKLHASNDTAVIVAESTNAKGWSHGTIRFEICTTRGHSPPSIVRSLLEKLEGPWIAWKGMVLIRSEHRSKQDHTLVYEADFHWNNL
jgi:hypothetical protein